MAVVAFNGAKAYYEEKHDKATFVKNIISDNILLGDIYTQAKELHFLSEAPGPLSWYGSWALPM